MQRKALFSIVLAGLVISYTPHVAHAQQGCGVPSFIRFSGSVQDYVIPLDAFSGPMTFTVKGGDGGGAALQDSGWAGAYDYCVAEGGRAAEVTGTFVIGTGPTDLQPGGTLRFVVGGAGQRGVSFRNAFGIGPAEYGGGGGGSALLYQGPSGGSQCSDWITLLVAGGGGGAHSLSELFFCRNRDGGDASTTTTANVGSGPNGGAAGTTAGIGGGCGTGSASNIRSTGGGGENGPSATCDGRVAGAGCPSGSLGAVWTRVGGFGYGAGGAADGGGGGGGGYAGGGGGSNGWPGGGGSSFISAWATNSSVTISNNGGEGFITWSTPFNLFVNDNCATAIPIRDGFIVGCTTSATESNEMAGDCPGAGLDVWYSYTNETNCDRKVRAAMKNDLGVRVYDACGGNVLACDQGDFSNPFGVATWTIPSGATHIIRLLDTNGGGIFQMDLSSSDPDEFAFSASGTVSSSTVGAGASGLSSCYGSLNSPDNRYDYVNKSGVPEIITASTCTGTNFDTVLSIHEACSGAQIVCSSDDCGEQTSVTWTAKPNVRYTIRVAGENGATGAFLLTIDAVVGNDYCVNALPLGEFGEYGGTLALATPTDPASTPPDTHNDIWFSYSHPDPNGCPMYVVLTSIYQYEHIDAYTDCSFTERFAFYTSILNDEYWYRINPGETLYFRPNVPDFNAENFPYDFTFDAGARRFTDGDASYSTLPDQSAYGFSNSPFIPERAPSCGTAAAGLVFDGFLNQRGYPIRLKATLCQSAPTPTFDSLLSVQRVLESPFVSAGNDIQGFYDACLFEELACDDDSSTCTPLMSEVSFDLQPGKFVDFMVFSKVIADGAATLTVDLESTYPPSNDDCGNALPIGDGITFGVNVTATNDGPAASCASNGGKGMWYSYTNGSLCARRVTFDTCGGETSFDAVVSVLDSCGGNELACGTPNFGCTGGRVTLDVDSGQTVLVRVSSLRTAETGRFRLTVTSEDIDPLGFGLPGAPCTARNDLCSDALTLFAGAQPGTLANATSDIDPSCATGVDSLPDVWYAYTNQASCASMITISTCFNTGANEFRTLTGYDGCGGTELVCDSGGADPNDDPCATISWSIPAGATHLIRVGGTQGTMSADEFTLAVTSLGADDQDGDGIEDACDNCLNTANAGQTDSDSDGFGDACDLCEGFDDTFDADGDSVPDGCDQCNGFDDLLDTDGDGVADGCDVCPNDSPNDLDGNGTCGAQAVVTGTLQPGSIYVGDLLPYPDLSSSDCAGDRPETFDFWTFTAQAGDVITIEVDRLGINPDPQFSVWQGDLDGTPLFDFAAWDNNANQTLVATADDDELPAQNGTGGDPTLFGFVVPSTDIYTVLVAGICESVADANRYQIRLDVGGLATISNITRATTHSSIQIALNAAQSGDVIEIGAGYVFEDNISFPAGLNVTLRGVGRERSIIDAEQRDPFAPALRMANSGQTSATVIKDLTIQKDVDQLSNRGALWLDNVSPRIENVAFVNNSGPIDGSGAADVSVTGASANPIIDRCLFIDTWGGLAAVETLNGASVSLINCAFDESTRLSDGQSIGSAYFDGGSATVMNCTMLSLLDHQAATVNVTNSAFTVMPQLLGNITIARSIYSGATGDNIDGAPSLVDPDNNDFSLMSDSLGIDAADYDAYVASGGGMLDAGGQARSFDDVNTVDTGTGVQTYLDIGAFEFFFDSDGDGVGDGTDVCPGFDDSLDTDGDGIPDGCDSCPLDAEDDFDGDGVCNSEDLCPGLDDSIDTDGDQIPDCAEAIGDECPFFEVVGNETVTGSLDGYSGGTGDDDTCAFNNTIDRWFRYRSTATGTLVVTTCHPGSQFDTVLSIFDDCPEAGGVEIFCNDDTVSSPPGCQLNGLNRLSTIELPVMNNELLFVRLSVYNDDVLGTGGIGSNFEISFSAEGDGDECEIARIANVGVNTGTLVDNGGATGANDDSCGASFNSIDEWFAYTATIDGTVTFSTCSPNGGFNTILSLFDDCPANGGTELACNDDAADQAACQVGVFGYSQIDWQVTEGTTYFVRVSAKFNTFDPEGPAFELTVTEQSSCTVGDTNGDGAVDLSDIASMVNLLLNSSAATEAEFCAADVNADGKVDGLDIEAFMTLLLP